MALEFCLHFWILDICAQKEKFNFNLIEPCLNSKSGHSRRYVVSFLEIQLMRDSKLSLPVNSLSNFLIV